MILCHLLIFSKPIFSKIILGIPSECQTDWIQIRSDALSGLIRVQIVCKGYQQDTRWFRVKPSILYEIAYKILVLGASVRSQGSDKKTEKL